MSVLSTPLPAIQLSKQLSTPTIELPKQPSAQWHIEEGESPARLKHESICAKILGAAKIWAKNARMSGAKYNTPAMAK